MAKEATLDRAELTDGRVRRNIVRMGRASVKKLGEDLPAIFPDRAKQKAAFRVLLNSRTLMVRVPYPHIEMTTDR